MAKMIATGRFRFTNLTMTSSLSSVHVDTIQLFIILIMSFFLFTVAGERNFEECLVRSILKCYT